MKCKVGIFFGGASRRRETSFAGGRNALNALDRSLFEAVPVWVSEKGEMTPVDPGIFLLAEMPDEGSMRRTHSNSNSLSDPELQALNLDFGLLTLPDPEPEAWLRRQGIPYAGRYTPDPAQVEALEQQLEQGTPSGMRSAFRCLVVRRDDQAAVAMPPMKEDGSILEGDDLLLVRRRCERVFDAIQGPGLALVQGSLNEAGDINIHKLDFGPALDDEGPVFPSLSQIGLNPSQSLTFLLSSALQGAIARQPDDQELRDLLQRFSQALRERQTDPRRHVGVLMGGKGAMSFRSREAGKNVLNLLAAMPGYLPVPLWLVSPKVGTFQVLQLPLADLYAAELPALSGKTSGDSNYTALEIIRDACQSITERYGSAGHVMVRKGLNEAALARTVDAVFIQCANAAADNGDLQQWLQDAGIPFTGPDASSVRINADQTLALKMLQHQGFPVPAFEVVRKGSFRRDPEHVLGDIEARFTYPLLASPASRREKVYARRLDNRQQLEAFLRLGFGSTTDIETEAKDELGLDPGSAFPRQDRILLSEVPASTSPGFRGLLVGMTTSWDASGTINYNVFPPRETGLQHAGDGGLQAFEGSGPTAEISRQASQLAEQAARALEVQGLTLLELLVLDDGQSEPMMELTGLQAAPLLVPGHAVFRLAHDAGTEAYDLLDKQLDFALQRPSAVQAVQAPAPVKKKPSSEPLAKEPSPQPAHYAEPVKTPPLHADARTGDESLTDRLRAYGGKVWAFLRSRYFLRNFGLLVCLAIIALLLTNLALKVFTHHGEARQVGDYVGKKLDEVEKLARTSSFRTVVIDSVFMLEREPNVVIEQDPVALSRVKKNRRIYLTITSGTAPLVQLPGLQGSYDYDQYKRKMLRLKLKPKVLDRRYDNKLNNNSILYLVYEGREIREEELSASGGIKVPVGSEIGFVVTERITEQVPVPDLVCKGYQEAAFLINSNNLTMGDVDGDVADRRTAYVYQQVPAAGEMIEKGSSIDISLSPSPPAECDGGN